MKTFKLWVHQKTSFNGEELVVNAKDFPNIRLRSVVEIYQPEDDTNRLLLQVTSFIDDFQQKETVSIEQSIASTFQLRTYQDVIVNIVEPQTVALDLVELCFKDQYFSRSDMWRLANTLQGTCVYQNKKVAFSEMRANVNEIWARGERMTCGYITEDTKVVYRSSTAVVNIFLQMSQEMWDFDAVGDLYFEKANEFLKALFTKWSEKNCCHDVTIVMFSRTFYDAESRDEFPPCMKDCIQEDYRGRFYEDFYHVVAQNERLDVWTSIIIELKKLFVGYHDKVLRHHCNCGQLHVDIDAYNSTAAQGNFLEVINMSLNVYENFNIDRNFDRTGKMAMVITPGAGVFEVNRELTNVTKQRTIDNGIGMDIVCMAEQPLHVVPLFKFHSKWDDHATDVAHDYNLPHWINISFYQSASQIQSQNSSSFVPRIKFGLKKTGSRGLPPLTPSWNVLGEYSRNSDNFPFMDFDEYDAQVFKVPKSLNSGWKRGKRSSSSTKTRSPQKFNESNPKHRMRTISDDFHFLPNRGKRKSDPVLVSPARSSKITSDDSNISLEQNRSSSMESLDSESESSTRFVVGSDSSVGNKFIRASKIVANTRRTAPLINPFAPARMCIKITPNRRRWIHAFPMDPKGTTIRQHCYMERDDDCKTERNVPPNVVEAAQIAVEGRKHRARLESGSEHDPRCSPTLTSSSSTATIGHSISTSQLSGSASQSALAKSSSSSAIVNINDQTFSGTAPRKRTPGSASSKRMAQIRKDWNDFDSKPGGWSFGPTGESEWSPSLTLGVDWKSLCIPAHLPVTTDYFPIDEKLKKDYCLFPAYSLIPDDIYPEISSRMDVEKRGMDACSQIFNELISQRLAHGFQLITDDRSVHNPGRRNTPMRHDFQFIEYKMSIGRIFHRLTFNGKEIQVTRYNPMHSGCPIEINYRYRLKVTDADVYEPCATKFANQQLEQFNWNYLDHYICSIGEGDYGLLESFKFWRSRFFLLPVVSSATKKIIEGSDHDRCDIYEEHTDDEINQLASGFLRFMEALNKIRRPAPSRKPQPRKVIVPNVRKISHAQDTNDIKPTETRGRARHPSVPTKLHTSEVTEHHALTRGSSSSEGPKPTSTQAFLTQSSDASVSMDTVKTASTDNLMSNTLNVDSPLTDILATLQDPVDGISFLPKQAGLPQHCFVGSEAATWVECCVEGVETTENAVELLQKMIDSKLICHASGDFRHPFQQGFVLYHIVTDPEKRNPDRDTVIRFQNAWCEVELDKQSSTSPGPVPAFLMPGHEIHKMNIWRKTQTANYKQVNVDVDPNNKSDRKEWAVAQYHTKYSPESPFSLEIQWMVATGCILGDLVYSYFRKASSCGYHLLPVPVDQFALPQSKQGDPLRIPVFIPLKLNCLKSDPSQGLFDEFGADPVDHLRRLQLFQHAILKRFGFLHDAYSVNRSTSSGLAQDTPLKYVHCSGSTFVLIPDYPQKLGNNTGSGSPLKPRRRHSIHSDFVTRHGAKDHSEHAGFLWAWNFTLSKRWRSSNTGDEVFQDKMLSDFRRFCSNDENRLKDFWDKCWDEYRKNTKLNEDEAATHSADNE